MDDPSLHWIDTAFRDAGHAARDASEYWEQFLSTVELIYVYACLERDRRNEETTMAMGDTNYLAAPFEILWNIRGEALAKEYSVGTVAERFRLLYEAVLTMPELEEYTEESKNRVIKLLENPKVTTAMFTPLLNDKRANADQIH